MSKSVGSVIKNINFIPNIKINLCFDNILISD